MKTSLNDEALTAALKLLPARRRAVVEALLEVDSGGKPPTYSAVAERVGLSIGSVSQHLRHFRLSDPTLYAAVMVERSRQLRVRHAQAIELAESRIWQWRQRGARLRWLHFTVGITNLPPWQWPAATRRQLKRTRGTGGLVRVEQRGTQAAER